MRDHIKEAIDDLAAEARGRQFDNTVKSEDALAHVDDALAHNWVDRQFKAQSLHSLLLEIVEKHVDENAAKNIFASLLNASSEPTKTYQTACAALVGMKLAEVLKQHIAEDLSYEAQKLVDNWEPTDDEMARDFYPSEVSDPVWNDRYSMAREHNGATRVSRMR